MFVISPKAFHFGNRIKAKIYLLTKEESTCDRPLVHESNLICYYYTANPSCFIYLSGNFFYNYSQPNPTIRNITKNFRDESMSNF